MTPGFNVLTTATPSISIKSTFVTSPADIDYGSKHFESKLDLNP